MGQERSVVPASFELQQFGLVVTLRKAIRRMCGISPVRVRLEADWQNGKGRLVVSRGGPAVWVQKTNEMLELSFSAVLAPRNVREVQRAHKAFIRGDAVCVGPEKIRRPWVGMAVDSIRITQLNVSLDTDYLEANDRREATIDIDGVVCLSNCSVYEIRDDEPAEVRS